VNSMQDLGQYTKKNHVAIETRYVSLLIAGSIALVGLVFALGVLTGSRQVKQPSCPKPDPLEALDQKSNEPSPPPPATHVNLSFHESLVAEPDPVPTPASLLKSAEPLAPVLAESVGPVPPAQLSEPLILEKVHQDEPGVYTLQVGSFANYADAISLVRKLTSSGHSAFVVTVRMPERGSARYRVRIGPFQSERDARNYQLGFERRERIPAFVVKRRARG